ncbi:aromatic amino acid beta-eliminating lyase/threonine aldolase [Piromyces finnis]|uniref:Aromatic amino acid beta-eliminating lyase/threonine aldolase n=1 Tax=Piromyces finnis TaxID=1754191 RepID=A0A1Y1U5N0_9FUNG|nr:aromatic amino acid beta-eliminating lyase/threonine aldolase [Piromyces finnis]ORX50282.1 aromatic amino acid beta-eliminating lyase/threonine aldolase [Piromyces finnis]|eukprot:ORX33340.1 aromatic amino acid beta-eliminating lyase/threonine aldolase [Piromyces finnis]
MPAEKKTNTNIYGEVDQLIKERLSKFNPEEVIDFRSDTVSKPTKEMIAAMYTYPVGDDGYGEDPTVNLLEQTVANLAGKEAAMFVTSGIMSNQLALRSHLQAPPHSVLCDSRSHVFNLECGGVAIHAGALMTPVQPKSGKSYITSEDIEDALVHKSIYSAPTKLISLENTLDGEIMPIEAIKDIHDFARAKGLPLHLDGARLWNASRETGISIKDYAKYFDSVSLCFSKGLGAPIGSVLTGSAEFIERARQWRKIFGGAWRQAGHLAGACLYALENHFPQLNKDHAAAKYLGQQLEEMGYKLIKRVDTNMVWVEDTAAPIKLAELAREVASYGFKISGSSRFVVHLGNRDHVERYTQVMREIIQRHKEGVMDAI